MHIHGGLIDFLTSEILKDKLKGAKIHSDIFGSDHCPVELEIDDN